MIYSNILKKIRKEKRLTQKELAKKTGIHPSTISHIEKGVRAGSVTTLLKICQALDIDLADFRLSGSIYGGIDTIIGPLYLAYGFAEKMSNRSYYLYLGHVF